MAHHSPTGRSLCVGCHLSSSKGFLAMGREALGLDAGTFQFFTRNPRGAKARPLDEEDAANLAAFAREHAFGPLIAHAPYILNPCSADPGLRGLAREIMADDLARLRHLPGVLYNLHPGSHGGQGAETGIAQLAASLDAVLPASGDCTVLLETMAGKGSEIGASFAGIAAVIRAVEHGENLGVCLDTCHVWDAGYDIANSLDGVLEEFDREIGIERLKAVHINDSMNARGARKDRHAKLGQGAIGLAAMGRIINHPWLRDLPFCLETPNDADGYAEEIAVLRGLRSG